MNRKARDYLFGQVMKANPAFDPAVVGEVLDERIRQVSTESVELDRLGWLAWLREGDVIRHLGSGEAYVVVVAASHGSPPVVARHLTATNVGEWERAIRCVYEREGNR